MEKLNNIRLSLIIEQPFFGYLLMHISFKRNDTIENIGTDGEAIYYNEKFVEEADENEIKFLIMHQILHLILNHVIRSAAYSDSETFNKASDLVVNSIVCESLPNYKVSKMKRINTDHTIEGKEASNWTVDQVYEKIKKINLDNQHSRKGQDPLLDIEGGSLSNEMGGNSGSDDHSMWKNIKDKSKFQISKMMNGWLQRLNGAAKFASNRAGNMTGGLNRLIKFIEREKVNWKDALRNFVETEINDYSFNPPDKRYTDVDFLLPDFNETEDKVTGIFFFIDASGSMNDEQIAECKAELRSCIKQYNGKIEGYLGYFDYQVSELQSFSDDESMEKIEVLGGGGTSFTNIFKYLDENSDKFDVEKKKVVIMTDGYAEFPDESSLNVDEVLWIINNDDVNPPFGEVIRI